MRRLAAMIFSVSTPSAVHDDAPSSVRGDAPSGAHGDTLSIVVRNSVQRTCGAFMQGAVMP